jgi:RES domain-containing protein
VTLDRDLAVAISRLPTVSVEGVFERHVSQSWVNRALIEGSRAGGRWAAPGTFPVLYLGRPPESVVVEAYRHLVDDVEGMSPERVRSRYLLRAQVAVTDVVDLRSLASRLALGLSDDALVSDVGDYVACQRIGHAAHQLNRHGILAPAATGLGETLALLVDFLPVSELPQRVGEAVLWQSLPDDPRRLRLLRAE